MIDENHAQNASAPEIDRVEAALPIHGIPASLNACRRAKQAPTPKMRRSPCNTQQSTMFRLFSGSIRVCVHIDVNDA
jgi:hypothetical protein